MKLVESIQSNSTVSRDSLISLSCTQRQALVFLDPEASVPPLPWIHILHISDTRPGARFSPSRSHAHDEGSTAISLVAQAMH